MKIALLVVIGTVMLSACVVIIGLLLPKGHVVSRSASFHATPDELFSLIDGSQAWRPDVVRYETVPDAAGKKLVSETTRNGETITYELVDRVPHVSLTRRIANRNLPYSGEWTFSLQPSGATTIVRITERGEIYNPVFRFMSRFILGNTRTIDAYLQALEKALKQKIEIHD
jgi:hypothetical protein